MAYYQDYRDYLEALESRGKLTRIKREINKDTELHSLVKLEFRGLPEDERTVFLFENIVDSRGRKYDIPVAVPALAASPQTYAIGMMCQPQEITEKLAYAEMHPIAPRLVKRGPAQEEVHIGDGLLEHGGLEEFPIPVTTPGYDAAPYITAPYFITKDPDTGIPNIGMYRAMVKSPTRTGIMFATPNRCALIQWRKCMEQGKPLEAAIVIGGPPSVGYASVYRLPYGVSEFGLAGGIAGEPVGQVKCKTVDLEVPATAEIVIEGEIDTRELEPEAPFGEALGFIGPLEMTPFFTVKCITHRKRPIWLATVSQYPPSESSMLRQYINAATIYNHLRHELEMSHVLGVSFFNQIGSSRLMAIKLKKVEPAEIWRTLEAAANRFSVTKIIIGVDEDVNIDDLDSVLLAVCMRCQAHRDYRIEKIAAPSSMDLSMAPMEQLLESARGVSFADIPQTSRLLIDATIKWPYPPLSLPKKPFMERALQLWQEEGLPKLKLKEPWWGINLGYWTEENEDLAMSAVRGEYYQAGKVYAQRRQPTRRQSK